MLEEAFSLVTALKRKLLQTTTIRTSHIGGFKLTWSPREFNLSAQIALQRRLDECMAERAAERAAWEEKFAAYHAVQSEKQEA